MAQSSTRPRNRRTIRVRPEGTMNPSHVSSVGHVMQEEAPWTQCPRNTRTPFTFVYGQSSIQQTTSICRGLSRMFADYAAPGMSEHRMRSTKAKNKIRFDVKSCTHWILSQKMMSTGHSLQSERRRVCVHACKLSRGLIYVCPPMHIFP